MWNGYENTSYIKCDNSFKILFFDDHIEFISFLFFKKKSKEINLHEFYQANLFKFGLFF